MEGEVAFCCRTAQGRKKKGVVPVDGSLLYSTNWQRGAGKRGRRIAVRWINRKKTTRTRLVVSFFLYVQSTVET